MMAALSLPPPLPLSLIRLLRECSQGRRLPLPLKCKLRSTSPAEDDSVHAVGDAERQPPLGHGAGAELADRRRCLLDGLWTREEVVLHQEQIVHLRCPHAVHVAQEVQHVAVLLPSHPGGGKQGA